MDIEYINLDEFCTLTGWSKNTAYKYIKDLPGLEIYHFGRFLRFRRENVIQWLNENTK